MQIYYPHYHDQLQRVQLTSISNVSRKKMTPWQAMNNIGAPKPGVATESNTELTYLMPALWQALDIQTINKN